ncbi:MAG: type II toxin-antitoxin system death-on-curing family toxin [Bryobacterales bacterium]
MIRSTRSWRSDRLSHACGHPGSACGSDRALRRIRGLRDIGALESALYRPQTGYYNDLIEQAAALWESLAQNHPFVDGNKRVAFAATYTFLAINGLTITADPEATYVFVIGLFDRNAFRFENLEPWLRNNVQPRQMD